MCHEFIPRHLFINKLERYNEQNPLVYSNMINSACEIAHQYHYQLRETIMKPEQSSEPLGTATAPASSSPALRSSSYEYINGEIVHNVEHKAAMKMMGEKSFFRLEYDVNRGGLQTPYHVSSLCRIPFAAANIGLGGAYVSNTSAVIRLLDYYPNIRAKDSLIGDMIHGESHGAVCLTERHSNISLTDVRYSTSHPSLLFFLTLCSPLLWRRCRADFFSKDRSFRVRGTKSCVYGGTHEFGGNIVSLPPSLPLLLYTHPTSSTSSLLVSLALQRESTACLSS
jgi:hypothetical protein